MQKYLNIFDFKQKVDYKNEILAGLTVAMTMIPESLMFAILAGFSPLVGLYGAFIMGLVTSIFGGRPGLISGAAGAVAVIFVTMISEGHTKGMLFDTPIDNMGYFYLLACVILMGIIQIFAGVFKIGKFVRLIPHSVMMGFVNGLAIVIFMAQLGMFTENSKDFYGQNKRKTIAKELFPFNVASNTRFLNSTICCVL